LTSWVDLIRGVAIVTLQGKSSNVACTSWVP
jgi:hypothetical protein